VEVISVNLAVTALQVICLMEVWIVVHAYYQLFIHPVIFIECVVTL